MKLSYEGIGAWSATFTGETVQEGQIVKMSGSGAVAPCENGDTFCGVALTVRGGVCAVQLGGMAEVKYSGGAPAVGYTALIADGQGGVTAGAGGRTCLVAAVDESAQICTISL